MKRILILAAAVAFTLTLAHPVPAQDAASQIVGVWKVKSFDTVDLDTGKSTKLYGEDPVGVYFFSKGHFSVTLGDKDRKKPATGVMSDEERLYLHRTMAATTGTYKVDGGKVHYTYTFAWNGAWTGTTRIQEFTIVGNVMTQKSPVAVSTTTGAKSQFTVVLERIE